MCFLVPGDHKVNISSRHFPFQVVQAGTIFYILFSQYYIPHQCDQRKVLKLYTPVSALAIKIPSFQNLKSIWERALGTPCYSKI